MKNIIKKHTTLCHILVIILIAVSMTCFVQGRNLVFGAYYDWFDQSVGFYEYFRNLFYETGKLFPNLALHIGGGQNIYYFIYYGLFSPYLLLSYLFPFVRSGDFIMIINILSGTISAILFYIFMNRNNYSKQLSLYISLLFLFAAPLFARAFIHVMMVHYMPFLILGLIGTKKYLDENKSLLLVISVVLLITTSYYFSIPAIICLCIYALYYYIKINENAKFKNVFNAAFKYACRILLGIVISCFILLPVIFTILNGRITIKQFIDLNSFIPKMNLNFILYSSYGIGLTAILVIALIYNFIYMKKANKVLTIILSCMILIPIFNLVLNGMLYENGKVFIPFIPLFLILIIEMIRDIKKIKIYKLFVVFVITIIFSILFVRSNYVKSIYNYYCDLVCTFVLLLLFNKKKHIIYIIPVILLACYISFTGIRYAALLTIDDYNDRYDKFNANVSDFLNVDTNSIYRYQDNLGIDVLNYSDAISQYKASVYSSTSNGIYNEVFYNTFNNNYRHNNLFYLEQSNNLFFMKFMGIRYLNIYDNPPYGYSIFGKHQEGTIYENDNVYSIGFASSNILSYEDYNKLSFIEKLEAYIYNIIVDGESSNSDLNFNYEKNKVEYEIKESKKINVDFANGHYILGSGYDGKMILSFKEKIIDKVLVIRFKIDTDLACDTVLNPTNRLSININGIENIITCQPDVYYNNNTTFDYVISSNEGISEITMSFVKGIYDISDIELYTIDNKFFDKNNTTPMEINFDKTKGDDIYGSIDVLEDGYFIFTIPYDKGYTLYVDGIETNIEMVNDGFIGFKINKGYHDIHLTFEAPYARLGRIISLIGILILAILCMFENKKISIKTKQGSVI